MPASRFYSSVAGAMTLQAGITSTDTTIAVDDVTGLPTSYPYTLFLDYGTTAEEIVDVTNAVGTNLTVQRGKDGTIAQAHSFGAVIRHGVSGRDHRESREHEGSTAAHGVAEVVGTTEQQVLDRKDFEPQGDHAAVVLRSGASNVEPVLDFRDGTDGRMAKWAKDALETTDGTNVLFRVRQGTSAYFWKRVMEVLVGSDVHAITGNKLAGATGRFLRLLASDGTTETFSVDADGNVAAQDVSAQDVAVAGTLSGPTVTALQSADTAEAAAREALDTRVDAIEGDYVSSSGAGVKVASGSVNVSFSGSDKGTGSIDYSSAGFSSAPAVVVSMRNSNYYAATGTPTTTSCTVVGGHYLGSNFSGTVAASWVAVGT